ncbi:3-oxoacyl-ACP reductase FabG [Candidatus Pandoraea novymonadis]|uniref:3-oxoacyl-[acyl-carrier-protein] reductase n=1 Tax=Candidatus Pandoraea novymonadis TaxID=1808959 RepID=A0ABX5FEJ7_9BURK|nr:3-oxoacyl-ACP reductase FabG [Candidatus Pandoraea novymonadis]PSB91647.1 3-oxoacyl-[acyl-carrier-protein] reductase FabG [Candidatus Pandoraea novymonadis]
MSKQLENQMALVTGASRGIGRAIVLELARQGAFVIGTATSDVGAEGISAYLAEANLSGIGIVMDVTDAEGVAAAIKNLISIYGKLDILVNNAGITRDNLVMRMKDDEWDDVIDTNLKAVFRLSRAGLKLMMKTRYGRIINITSVVGAVGNPGQANYAGAKAGVSGMARALAREIGSRNITVNCVSPGFIDTDMTKVLGDTQHEVLKQQIPLGRLGKPEEVAYAVGFLASSQASYITGVTLHVNGGMFMG